MVREVLRVYSIINQIFILFFLAIWQHKATTKRPVSKHLNIGQGLNNYGGYLIIKRDNWQSKSITVQSQVYSINKYSGQTVILRAEIYSYLRSCQLKYLIIQI